MRVLAHAVSVVVGAAVSVATVAVHRSELLGLPTGLVLGLATTFVVAWSVREMLAELGASFAAGWVVALGFFLFGRPEGDYLVATDLRGYLLLGSGLALVVFGVWCLSSAGRASTGPT